MKSINATTKIFNNSNKNEEKVMAPGQRKLKQKFLFVNKASKADGSNMRDTLWQQHLSEFVLVYFRFYFNIRDLLNYAKCG